MLNFCMHVMAYEYESPYIIKNEKNSQERGYFTVVMRLLYIVTITFMKLCYRRVGHHTKRAVETMSVIFIDIFLWKCWNIFFCIK